MNKSISLYFTLSMLLLFVGSCDSTDVDEEYRQAIVGTWMSHHITLTREVYGETEYKPDGTMIGKGYIKEKDEKIDCWFFGTWEIKDAKLIETMQKGNVLGEDNYLSEGHVGIDTILLIDDKKLVYLNNKKEEITRYRVNHNLR